MTVKNEFLQKISTEEVIGALPNIRIQEFEKGIVLVRESSTPGSCYFIVSGRVQVRKKVTGKNKLMLATVGKGQFFGEMSMLSGEKRSASATALSKVKVLEIRRVDFARLVKDNHPFATKLTFHFAVILATRAHQLLHMLAYESRHAGKPGKVPSVDMRQAIHQMYSVWAI